MTQYKPLVKICKNMNDIKCIIYVLEPIYENIPLNWTPEGNEPRSRAASIQSAPEMRIPQEQFKANQHQNHQPPQLNHQPQHNHQSPQQNIQNNHQSQSQQAMQHNNHQSQTQLNQQSHQLVAMQPSQQSGSSPSHDRIHGFNVSIGMFIIYNIDYHKFYNSKDKGHSKKKL